MSTEGRRLAAIMCTDVVGYSRLIADDQRRALDLLRDLRAIIPPLIAEWRGTLHREIGDGTLSSFPSAVDAASCALAIQQRLRDHAEIELRIGLHVGDVLIEGNEVHGDGVDIATRIEPLAPPGGIAFSDAALIQVRGKLDLPLRSIGQPMLKNIGLPMEIFVCDPPAADGANAPGERAGSGLPALWQALQLNRVLQWLAGYVALAFAVLQGVVLLVDLYEAPALISRLAATLLAWGVPAAAVLAWYHGTPGRQRLVHRELAVLGAIAGCGILTLAWQVLHAPPDAARPAAPLTATASPANAAAPALPNSVVVLPFENRSGDAQDAYLSDGFTDELRDQLSRVPGLRVVARGSSIAFRGSSADTRTIAAKLGVATVIEGSLLRQGKELRITVRLSDAASGLQRWSQAYDRNTDSMLAVQQEVALAAAKAILPQLSTEDIPKPQWNASVHDLMLLARSYAQSAVRPQDQDRLIDLYEQVLARDPQSASAHARLGRALMLRGKDPIAAEQHLRRALALDPDLAEGYANLGFLLWSQFRPGAGAMFRRAIELNPNDADAQHQYGHYANLQGQGDESRSHLLRAVQLDPMSLLFNADYAWQFAVVGRQPGYEQAIATIVERFPDAAGREALGGITETGGELDEAVAWGLESLKLDPDSTSLRQQLAQRYARLGLTDEARRMQPEPSLRVLFFERRYADIVATMESMDPDEADADSMSFLAFALQAVGRERESVGVLQSLGMPRLALEDDLRRWSAVHLLGYLIGALDASGEQEQARSLASWLLQFSQRQANAEKGWGVAYWSACALAVLGRQDEALAAFERGVASPSLFWLPLAKDSACLRSLRDTPRYQAAVRSLEARYAEIRERLPATLARHGLVKTPG